MNNKELEDGATHKKILTVQMEGSRNVNREIYHYIQRIRDILTKIVQGVGMKIDFVEL